MSRETRMLCIVHPLEPWTCYHQFPSCDHFMSHSYGGRPESLCDEIARDMDLGLLKCGVCDEPRHRPT